MPRQRSVRHPLTRAAALGFAIVVLATVAAACGNGDGGEDDGLSIVATTTILGDLARNVAPGATVETLMGPGQDPHAFSPSAAQVARLRSADLVLANGLGLEAGLASVLDSARADGVEVVEIGPLLDPLPLHFDAESSDTEADHGGEHAELGLDPHVWMDPLRMARAAEIVGERLTAVDPQGDWNDAAAAYRAELEALHDEIVELLSPIPAERRVMVTDHDALGYFADRYGFEIVGVIIPGGSTLAEPSAAELAALVDVIRERDVPAIFVEVGQKDRLARALAAEIGATVEVVELYVGSLGPEGSGAETYVDMMRLDARRIADALASPG